MKPSETSDNINVGGRYFAYNQVPKFHVLPYFNSTFVDSSFFVYLLNGGGGKVETIQVQIRLLRPPPPQG